jgi:hypothetical protein
MEKPSPEYKMKTKDFSRIIRFKKNMLTAPFFLGYNGKTFKKKYPLEAGGV